MSHHLLLFICKVSQAHNNTVLHVSVALCVECESYLHSVSFIHVLTQSLHGLVPMATLSSRGGEEQTAPNWLGDC